LSFNIDTVVSVIMPTYNRAPLIVESIQSVFDQGFADLELIIVDDGSDDDTRKIVESVDDKRIRYYQFPHSGHTGRLKNFAIRESRGDIVAFLDSDDMWKKDKLQRQISLLEKNPQIGFSITDVTTFQGEKILIDHSYALQNTVECVNLFPLLKSSRFLVYPSTLVMRKSCFDRCGYFDEDMLSGDFHFNIRLAFYFEAGVIYETLLWRRVHDNNMSEQIPLQNYAEYVDTFEYLYREKMIDKKYLLKTRSVAFYKLGKMKTARKYFGPRCGTNGIVLIASTIYSGVLCRWKPR